MGRAMKKVLGFILALSLILGTLVGGAVVITITMVNCGIAMISPFDEIEDVVDDIKDRVSDLFFDLFASEEQKIRKANAALIVKIGEERGFTPRSIAIAVATAIQETNLENRPYNKNGRNDHDSLGIYQQRPSQGWGTPEQIMDLNYAINLFYDKLQVIPDRDARPMMDVAIQIQNPSRSAYASRWAWDEVAAEIVQDNYKGDGKVGDNCTAEHSSEWQTPLAEEYCVTGHFGDTHLRKFPHRGVDLACNGGDPIRPAARGTVTQAGWNGGFGFSVTIDHGGGVETLYAHMIEGSIPSWVKRGATAEMNTVIGSVGNTGNSRGAHLHYEVHLDGKAVDPEKYMRDMGIPLD